MLKNLVNRIKSQKSSNVKIDEPNRYYPNKMQEKCKEEEQMKGNLIRKQSQQSLIQQMMNKSESQICILKGQINKVRYWTCKQIPKIFNQVLSCPISHYNLLPHSKRKVKQIDLKKHKFPEYLEFMKPLLQRQLPTYNHLLINHYPKGVGIMPHFDGPMYRSRVVVLSFGGPVLISFQGNYSKNSKSMKIILEDKSVHIFEEEAYQKYLHGIQDNKVDVLTFSIFTQASQQVTGNIQMNKLQSKGQSQQNFFIGQCSIKNLGSAKSIRHVIEKYYERLTFRTVQSEQDKFCFEFRQFQGNGTIKGCFVYINPDVENQAEIESQTNNKCQKFRWKMQIERQQRISITIRQQFSDQFSISA